MTDINKELLVVLGSLATLFLLFAPQTRITLQNGALDSPARWSPGNSSNYSRIHCHQHHHPAEYHRGELPPFSSVAHLTNRPKKLNQFTREPDYIAYLAYILSQLIQEEDRIRTIAGYLLKNNARLILSAPPEVGEFVKESVLSAFNDKSVMIRNAASQDIVAFLGVLEPRNWPQCLEHLVLALDSSDLDRQEVSFLISCFL